MYIGYKEINKNGATGEITIIDTREIDPEKVIKINNSNTYYTNKILEVVPEFKQRNIGMGIIIDPEKTQLLSAINDLRNQCTTDQANITACTSLDQLDALNIPY